MRNILKHEIIFKKFLNPRIIWIPVVFYLQNIYIYFSKKQPKPRLFLLFLKFFFFHLRERSKNTQRSKGPVAF